MKVTLTDDEALVLSDWLDRVMHRDDFAQLVDDRAVWAPLVKLSGSLETQLPVIFDASYADQLEAARERLVARLGDFGK